MILRGPGIPAGGSSSELVYLHDLFPTLLDLAGGGTLLGLVAPHPASQPQDPHRLGVREEEPSRLSAIAQRLAPKKQFLKINLLGSVRHQRSAFFG